MSRNNLDKRHREIATIAALTALGNVKSQLKFHINAGLNVGLTDNDVKEIMLLMTIYAGFPAAINGTNALKEVLSIRNHSSKATTHSAFDEILKDTDVLQHCLYNPLFPVMEHEKCSTKNLNLNLALRNYE